PGLSSTRRISMGFTWGSRLHREPELDAFADARLNPNPSPVALDDLLADRETNPRPRVLPGLVEALEDEKYALSVFGPNPDPVVPHAEGELAVLGSLGRDRDD